MDILMDLYDTTGPDEASLITQIILKDIRPIISPLKYTINTTVNLLSKKPARSPMTIRQALGIWHPTLPRLYDIYASISELFEMLENGSSSQLKPVIGIPVQVRK